MNAWHVLVTDSCGCIWAPRSVTRDARVVALRVMPELSPEMRSSVLDSTCGQCHFCVSWKLALCGVTLFWQVLTSHDKYQIMRKWRGESDISKCNFHAMRQKKRISGVVRPGAMNLLLVIVHVRFMSMSGRHKFHGLSPLYVWWPVPLREVCVWWATREIEEGGKLLNQVSPLPSDILHISNVK